MNTKRRYDWEYHVKNWEESEGSLASYCREHRLSTSTFKYHLDKAKTTSEPRFVRVGGENEKKQATLIEITIGDGVTVKIPEGISPARIKEIVECLR